MPAKMVSLPLFAQQCTLPACLVSKPVFVFLSNDTGQGIPKWQKPGQLCVAMESCCLHKGGEGNSGWEDDRGRYSPSSMVAFLKSQYVDSVLQLKITQASNKGNASYVIGTNTQNKVPWEMPFLYRNIFSCYLETPVINW